MKSRLLLLAFALVTFAGAAAMVGLLRAGSGDEAAPTAASWSNASADIQRLEQRVRDRPGDSGLLLRLGALYLVRARETGDPAFYDLAGDAATRALDSEPENVNALVLEAEVALARHDFAGALALAERARALNPDVVAVYGVLTDALVELGRYEEAVVAAQQMVDRRPDFAAYTRVSYLRELHGDLSGAIAAMEQAAGASGTPFDEAWSLALLGNLHLASGELAAAETAYERAARALPDDAMTLMGQARIATARGEFAEAEDLLRRAVAQRPLPEYATTLGELLESQGRITEAEEHYALVRATQQLFDAGGVDTDIEMALFEADHGDPRRAYDLAVTAFERQPGIYGADVLAWAAYKSGRKDEASAYIYQALRLGSRDPRILYHAAVIAGATGDPQSQRRYLGLVQSGALALPPMYASDVARMAGAVVAND